MNHRLAIVISVVASIVLAFALTSPVQGGVHNCTPRWKCLPAPSATAAPSPSIRPSPSASPVAPSLPATPAPTQSPTPAPTPSPSPTASPSPTPARPFAAPVTSRTIQVTGDPNAAIAGALSGTILEFPAGASYTLAGLAIIGKSHLVLHGNGAILHLTGDGTKPDYSAFFLRGSHDIAIDGFTVLGNNPDTTNIFVPGKENAHVLALSGWYGLGPSWNIELSGVTASHIYGDFAYLEGQNTSPNSPSHHVWVHGNTGTWIGRNAVSYINVTDVLIEGNSFDRIGMDALDIEPNFAVEQARRATFRANTIGAYGYMTQFHGWFVNSWNPTGQSPVSDITVTGNQVAGNPAGRFDGSARALAVQFHPFARASNVVVTDNRTTLAARGPVMTFANVTGVTVQRNAQPLLSGVLASFTNCSGVVQ